MKSPSEHRIWRTSMAVLFTFTLAAIESVNLRVNAEDHPLYGRELAGADKADTLQMLASKMLANYKLMKTWRGTYAMTEMMRSTGKDYFRPENRLPGTEWTTAELPGDILAKIPVEQTSEGAFWKITTGNGTFSIDNTKGMFTSVLDASQPIVFFDPDVGMKVRSTNSNKGPIAYSIFSTDDAIRFDPRRNELEIPGLPVIDSLPSGRVVHRVPLKDAYRGNDFFDPRDYLAPTAFRHGDNRRQHWSYCERMAGLLQTAGEFQQKWDSALSLYVNSELPPIYTLIVNTGKGGEDLYQFDGKASFNVVRRHQKLNGELFNQAITTYRNSTGIYVAETYERTSNQELPEGGFKPRLIRFTALVKSEMNVELANDEFSITRLPLKYGDRLADEIGKRLLVHDGVNGFVPADGFVFDPSRAKP